MDPSLDKVDTGQLEGGVGEAEKDMRVASCLEQYFKMEMENKSDNSVR